MEISIQKLSSNHLEEFIQLIGVFEKAFEMDTKRIAPTEHLISLLEKDDFLVITANHQHQVIGGLTAYILKQYYSGKPLIFIYDLAVNTDYQRKGVGKKLIGALIEFGKTNAIEEIFVQAEKIDEHALKFYRSTGAQELDTSQFYYKLL